MLPENKLSDTILFYGSPEPLPVSVPLRAGSLEMVYQEGALRYVKTGNIEILRMVYVALRDRRWGTYVAHITNERIEVLADSFQITFTCSYYLQQVLLFSWDALLTGDASGKLHYQMKGQVQADFEKNRLGICVLHPIEFCKGRQITVTHPDQTATSGIFPVQVSPHQLFKNIREIEWFPDENISASIQFEGDIFEMEDQRNWTDASYKTYSTPLEIPFPAQVKKGDTFHQTITLQVKAQVTNSPKPSVCTITPDWQGKYPLPKLGISCSQANSPLRQDELNRLKACNFSYYRIELNLTQTGWPDECYMALQEAHKLESGIALALNFNTAEQVYHFLELSNIVDTSVHYLILYFPASISGLQDREEVIRLCRQKLPGVKIGIGTRGFFADVNRNRPAAGTHDFMVFSVNPQVHAFDNATLVENLEAQKYALETAHQFLGGKEIHVSPVTLRPAFSIEEYSPDILPYNDDFRQVSLFAAGWTIGSLKYMAENAAAGITYFETIGKKGIMAGNKEQSGSHFPVSPHQLYPVFFVFRELAAWKEAEVVTSICNFPLLVSSLLLKNHENLLFLLANHTEKEVPVNISAFNRTWQARQMDAETYRQATHTDAFLETEPTTITHQITLSPFAFSVLIANK